MGDGVTLGIDLGTTNTAAAWALPDGQLRFVEVSEGAYSMPSAVYFHPDGAPLVGESARQMLIDAPAQTIVEMKRFLGRRFMSDFVGRHRSRYAFEIVEAAAGLAGVRPLGDILSLEDVSQRMLARVVELANVAAGQPFSECVLTVPTHFSYRQREALRRVAERTGLEVVAMIAEPTAAALYLLDTLPEGAVVLIYDLGGGTFDTTLLRVEDGRARVLAAGGDAFLGGADFDNRILEFLADHFTMRHGVDPRIDGVARARTRFAVENAKIALSHEEKATVHVPAVAVQGDRFLDFHYELDRVHLEKICAPLIERTLGLLFATLEQAGMKPEDATQLIPVGGQSKMPALQRRLDQHFRVASGDGVHQDLAVAGGAALRGLGRARLSDVLAIPVFGMTPGGGPRVLVEKNQPLPATARVPLPRPPEGGVLALPIYEAVDLTSIDRDVLGVLRAPPDWLAQSPGELHLDVAMDEAFALRFALATDAGSQIALELQEPSAPGAPVSAGAGLRGEERVKVALSVLVRTNASAPFAPHQTVDASPHGMFLASDAPLPLATSLELVLHTPAGPLTTRATVCSRIEPTAATPARPAGFGVRLRPMSPADAGRYAELLASAAAREQEAPGAGSPPPMANGADALKRFLDAVRRQELYEAVGCEPLDSAAVITERVTGLRAVVTSLVARATPEVKQRLSAAETLLERVRRTLLDPRARLTYDFQKGYVLADDRLSRAAEGGVFDAALCREVWMVVHGAKADEVPMLLAQASAAELAGDLRAAHDWARQALGRTPFDPRLRVRVQTLAGKVGAPVH